MNPIVRCRRMCSAAVIAVIMPVVTPSGGAAAPPSDPGLLFSLSGERGFAPDYAGGNPEPVFLDAVTVIPDGVRGNGFRIPDFSQVMAWSAPGNIYARRGTISFFFRARTPLGKTPFHIFQVSWCDHSSIDMAFIRIDWNGSGFEAFATDADLVRTRVSHRPAAFPRPDEWVHLAFAWDETAGVRLFVNGVPVAMRDTTAAFDAGLGLFGPHNRFINPQHIWANCGHIRGGDLDELRVYDRMLPNPCIARLAKGEPAGDVPSAGRGMDDPAVRTSRLARLGWNPSGGMPPALDSPSTAVRKVEIHEAVDVKQEVWKGADGIPETTWPHVYNRSRIPGRLDYFIEPDWNCYSLSGKTVTFTIPGEEWNRVEVLGAASGRFFFGNGSIGTGSFDRPGGTERTVHALQGMQRGGALRFENTVQETPIREFSVFRVAPGAEPAQNRLPELLYTVDASAAPDNPSLRDLVAYIRGRHLPDESAIAVALPPGAPRNPKPVSPPDGVPALPLVHILIPCDFRLPAPYSAVWTYSYTWQNLDAGLDGIAIDLPPLRVKPVRDGLYPLLVSVRDPLWPNRRLMEFSFSVRPGEARTLWLDTRDRILPVGKSLYLTIEGADGGFGPMTLNGARIRLVFKDREAAKSEHEADRIAQVVDNYGNIVECGPNSRKYEMFDRFLLDIGDLLRVNPDHPKGRMYWAVRNGEQGLPPFIQPEPPAGVPLWAFRQAEDLRLVKTFVNWWIDNRQAPDGEFGGGLSDDGDLTNQWPGPALMGVDPEKIAESLRREMDAFYANGMFTNGLAAIQADELHSYEEGINVLPQIMLLDYGDPKQVERMMATVRALDGITGVNRAGHRHIRSSYYGASAMAEEDPWSWSYPYSYLVFHPAMSLVDFNGNPKARKLVLELLDGLLAHRRKNPDGSFSMNTTVNFITDAERPSPPGQTLDYFWAAWRWTGDRKYLDPVTDQGPAVIGALNPNLLDILGKRDDWGKAAAARVTPSSGSDFARHTAWQMTGNTAFLEGLYADQIRNLSLRMPLMTEDQWWVDRVYGPSQELQRARLGGVALWRNVLAPGHQVSWRFAPPAGGESVAVLIPDARPDGFTVIAYNLESGPVEAVMTGWDVKPGVWEIFEGIDENGDFRADGPSVRRRVGFGRSEDVAFTFPPRKTTVVSLKLKKAGTPSWSRPDIGIGRDDVRIEGNTVRVTVHGLGSVKSPEGTARLVGMDGKTIAAVSIPPIGAPVDLLPKTVEVRIPVPPGAKLDGASVIVDCGRAGEITSKNNRIDVRR